MPVSAKIGTSQAHAMTVPPLFVHVWAPTERIYMNGHIDPRYGPISDTGRC